MAKNYRRIACSNTYKTVMKSGKKYVKNSCVIYVLQCDIGELELGIIASRKVGMAVERNRGKRLLRACFNDVFLQKNEQKNTQFKAVFIVRNNILRMKYRDIFDEVRSVF